MKFLLAVLENFDGLDRLCSQCELT